MKRINLLPPILVLLLVLSVAGNVYQHRELNRFRDDVTKAASELEIARSKPGPEVVAVSAQGNEPGRRVAVQPVRESPTLLQLQKGMSDSSSIHLGGFLGRFGEYTGGSCSQSALRRWSARAVSRSHMATFPR